ncbi:MAG: PAS domain S-box protein [Magnetococcales bacterium]|nr:PAS domain S-box protein [Magnetococcales bacterium]
MTDPGPPPTPRALVHRSPALVGLLLSLVLFLSLNGVAILLIFQDDLSASYHRHIDEELNLVALMVTDPLKDQNFQLVERLLRKWGAETSQLLRIKATTPDGTVLFDRGWTGPHHRVRTHRHVVTIDDQPHLTLEALHDLDAVQDAVHLLAVRFFLVTSILMILFGILFWWLLRRTVVRPLEREIRDHSKTRIDLEHTLGRLSESQGQLAAILEHASSAIHLKDNGFRYLLANRRFQELAGRTAEDIIGRTDFDLFPAPLARALRDNDLQVLREGTLEVEEVFPLGDGSHTFHSSKFLVPDAHGGHLGIGGIARDLTEQVRLRESFQLSRQSLAKAQKIAHLGSWDWNIPANTLQWSDEIYRIFGLAPREFGATYEAFLNAIHPDDRPAVEEAVRNSLADPSQPYDIVHRVLRPDGVIRIVHELAEITRNAAGAPLLMSGTVQDVTERKQAEERLAQTLVQLQEKENHLRSVLATALDGIITIDADGRVVDINPAAEKLFGYPSRIILGKDLANYLIPPPLRDKHHQALRRRKALAQHLPDLGRRLELPGLRMDGTTVDLEMALAAVWNRGEVYYTAFIHDITDRKQLLQSLRDTLDVAESANRAKSEFLANMSHEIRSPMNAIIGMTDLLLTIPLSPEEQRNNLKIVQQASESLLDLINDILDLSKIDAGRLDLERIPFDVCGQIENACETLAVKTLHKDLDIYSHIAADVPPTLIGDSLRLRQVLINLLNNAIKFTEQGEIIVRVDRQPPRPGDPETVARIHISVSDTGIGIPAVKAGLIFESFSQADGSTTRKYGGTGLGLTISRHLVTLMGGDIWFESEEHKGTVFHFAIPLPIGQRTAGTPPHGVEERSGGPLRKPLAGARILVFDDHPTGRQVVKDMLTGFGATVELAQDPDAWQLALEEACEAGRPFDLMILDHGVCRDPSLRPCDQRQHPGFLNVPLIMLPTGLGIDHFAHRDWLKGATPLSKPLRRYHLLKTVRRALGHNLPEERSQGFAPGPEPMFSVPLRILLVEDLPNNQHLATTILEQAGHRVAIADNGLEAIAMAREQAFDVILMDLQLPELDGIEATRRIRLATETPNARTPIIAVTARAMAGEEKRCLEAGMNGYLRKPYRAQELLLRLLPIARRLETRQGDQDPIRRNNPTPVLKDTGLDPALLADNREVFLHQMPHHLALLNAMIADRDQAGLLKTLSILRTAAAGIGAIRVSVQAIRLRSLGETREWDAAREALQKLEQHYDEAVQALAATDGASRPSPSTADP